LWQRKKEVQEGIDLVLESLCQVKEGRGIWVIGGGRKKKLTSFGGSVLMEKRRNSLKNQKKSSDWEDFYRHCIGGQQGGGEGN